MIRFITEHRDRFGVELICQVLRPVDVHPELTHLQG